MPGLVIIFAISTYPGDSMSRLLKIGLTGTIITALCCFTPVLVVLLGALGLSAVVGILDFVLLPLLAVFIAISGYALWKR